jgi:sirohydrochlorin cobaltochelatase
LKEGIVLFAHGSRDPEWSGPFEKISEELRRNGLAVRVAYLEIMPPPLADAIASLAGTGVHSIRVIPVFLGAGGHVKEDLPRLIASARSAHPKLKIILEKPIGEQPQVIAAIARAIAGY